MIAGKCTMWVNISSLPIPIENDQTSYLLPLCRWITAQITVDLYGGTVSIVQHFLYTKISVQSKHTNEHSFVSSETPGWRWLATWLPPPEWMIAVRRTWAMGEVCKMLLDRIMGRLPQNSIRQLSWRLGANISNGASLLFCPACIDTPHVTPDIHYLGVGNSNSKGKQKYH